MVSLRQSHPSLEELQDFAAGRNCVTGADNIEQHLSECDRCAATLSACDATLQLTQRIGAALRSEDRTCVATEELINRITSTITKSDVPGSFGRIAHYDLMELVGHGAFGFVFRAIDQSLNRDVAVKVLSPDLSNSPLARQRFVREAKAAAAIRHDSVVGIHAVGEDPLPYLVMEFVPGSTLQNQLDKRTQFTASQITQMAIQISRGLQAAHAMGLIHRDIKPGNILLEAVNHPTAIASTGSSAIENSDATPKVRLSDIGLARSMDFNSTMTADRLVMGTPAFMSPEQVNGESLDQRSDLFSLGSLLFTVCAGRPPFIANSLAALLHQVASGQSPNLRDLAPNTPEYLVHIVEKLMARDASQRYQSAAAVEADLLRIAHSDSTEISASPSPAAAVSVDRTRSKPRFWPNAILATLLMLFAALAVLIVRTGETEFVITTDDPDIATRIHKSGGIVVENLKTKAVYTLNAGPNRLPNGDYELMVTAPDGLELTTSRFQLRRFNGPLSATVVARPAAEPETSSESSKTSESPSIPASKDAVVNLPLSWSEPMLVPFDDDNSSGSNPTISGDGLRIIFVSRRSNDYNELFEAVRTKVDEPFGTAKAFQLSVTGSEGEPLEKLGTPRMSSDGLDLLVYMERPDVPGTELCRTSRSTLDESWQPLVPIEGAINADPVKYAPSERADGLEFFWFRPNPADVFNGELWTARRSTKDDPFEPAAQLVEAINTPESEQHPCLSHDGLTLLFDRGTPEPRLWYSVRSATSADFKEAQLLPLPDPWMTRNAYAPSLTSDGSTLFFTSNTLPGREGFESGQLWFSRAIEPKQAASGELK